ncbi:MAG: zosA [Bacillales bacterium]|jgi:Cd2+/Zn2+-exporting ATPase|nr:zosA [Bacillales bacterium]
MIKLEKLKIPLELKFAILSGVLIFILWLFNEYFSDSIKLILYITTYIIGGYFKTKEGVVDLLKNRKLTVEFLMILSAISAATIGSWHEGAVLIFIFALSGALETFTLNRNERELTALMKFQPETAIRFNKDTGKEEIIYARELQSNDIIIVKPGDRIPADCLIIEGLSFIDESTVTGESIPINKKINDDIYAGTINLSGFIKAKVLKTNNETLLGKIIELVQNANSEKPQTQLQIEKIENAYVRTVLIFVSLFLLFAHFILLWTWQESIYRAIILLVVASPCAVVSSIMPAVIAGITNAAKRGILIKGGTHLEKLATIDAIAFDKTGTLTNGKPYVTDYYIKGNKDHAFILSLIGSLENKSNHPYAKAVTDFIQNQNIKINKHIIEVNDHAGYGISGYYDSLLLKIGKPNWIIDEGELGYFFEEINFKDSDNSVMLVSFDGEIVAAFQVKDNIRKEAPKSIAILNNLGLETIMLTGDNESNAASIAAELGIKTWYSKCLPQTKVNYINSIKSASKNVAMVGDGINDAPALALADIGITLGQSTDVALETSDIILVKNDLTRLPYALKLSRKLKTIINQNLIFSFTIILILIIANLLQLINLPLSVIGHEGSTILVILNGLRLLKEIHF